MDNRRKLLDKIASTLSYYADTIRTNVNSGRTDILIDAEEICRRLLNTTFGWELESLNQTKRNYPAIDMADDDQRIAVQVTANGTRAKVQNTINRFCEYRFDQQYDSLLVFIAGNTKARFREPFHLPSHMDLRIMDFSDLIRELGSSPLDTLEAVVLYLDEAIGTLPQETPSDNTPITAPTTSVDHLSEIAQQVLLFARLFPDAGLEQSVFEHGLSLPQKKALPDLLKQNMLYLVDTVLRIHTKARSGIRWDMPVSDYKTFLDLLWGFEKSWRWERVSLNRRIAVQQSLAQIFASAAARFPELALDCALRSAELWRDIQEFSDALRLEQEALRILEIGQPDSWAIARARHFTGECHAALHEHDLARKDWEITLKLCQDPLHASAPDLAEAFHNVGKALVALKEYHSAEIHLLSALKLIERMRNNIRNFAPQSWCTDIYNSLATLYHGIGKTTTASRCSGNALLLPDSQKSLWKELYSERHILLNQLSLRSTMDSNAFVGREDELAEIDKRFATERIVVLSGLGGTGKTELAIRYGIDYQSANRGQVYFVKFHRDFFHTAINAISIGIPNFHRKGMAEQQIYNETLTALSRCWKDDLLILDNADEADFPKLCRVLNGLPLRILITSRQFVPYAITVSVLDRTALYSIFRQQEVDIPCADMDALIDAVDGHTLTVDLIARTMRRGRHAPTTDQLLTALKSYKLTDGFTKISTAYGNRSEQSRINDRLNAVFRVSGLTNDQQMVMRCAALLPQEGIDQKLFHDSFASIKLAADTLDTLLENGWLSMEGGLLCIHPVIRLVCITELMPTDESCEAFLEAVRAQYDPNCYDHTRYAQMAALFTEASTVLEDQNGYWANVAGHLWNELSEPQKALACNLRSVEKSEMHQPDSFNLSSAYSNVGYSYSMLGEYDKALEYKLKALAIRERVLAENHPNLALSYSSIGSTYSDLGDHRSALKYKLKALAIQERELHSKDPELAASYSNIGITYGDLGNHETDLEYQLKALAIREAVLPPDHPDLATSYDSVGTAYRSLGDYPKALEYQRKALSILERILPADHPHLAASYDNAGNIYSDLGEYGKALEYQLKSLSIRERILPGNHPDIALSYNHVGGIYYAMGDHSKALEYELKAMSILEQTFPENHPHLATAHFNMAWTYYTLGQLAQAAVHMRRAAEIISRSDLPSDHPDRESFRQWAEQMEQEQEAQREQNDQ